MGTTSKILGQSKPAAATPTDLYTVPGSTQAEANLFVCNQNATTSDKYRVALRAGGAAIDGKHYIAYDNEIQPGSTIIFSGLALNDSDVVTIRSTNGDVSFNLLGLEVT